MAGGWCSSGGADGRRGCGCARSTLSRVSLQKEAARRHEVHQHLAAHVADAPGELECFPIAVARYVCVAAIHLRDPEHRQVREQHAREPVRTRLGDGTREVIVRCEHVTALIVGIAQAAECASNVERRACFTRMLVSSLVRGETCLDSPERKAEVASQRVHAGTHPRVRRVGERCFGPVERLKRFLVPIHDAQGGGYAQPGLPMLCLIDGEVER